MEHFEADCLRGESTVPLFKKPEGQKPVDEQDVAPGLTFINPSASERRAAKAERKAAKVTQFINPAIEQRAAKAERKAAKKKDKQAERLEKLFWQSPSGRARAAKLAGQALFQIELTAEETARTFLSWVLGDVQTKQQRYQGQDAVLAEIEDEGWSLLSSDFVFKQTGAVSRDKLLSSGQSTKITGQTVGIYMFRATAAPARADEPWVLGDESQAGE